MRRITWSLLAAKNLRSIKHYIAQENPRAAERVATRIDAATLKLADAPFVGRAAGRMYRELTGVRPYIIRYRVEADRVIIVRIRHGARRPD